MTDPIILTAVPARHLTPGDHTGGFVISQSCNLPDGGREFKFVVPQEAHSFLVTVLEKDLDAVKFDLTKRGDDYSPNRRNEALGLPLVPPPVYVEPEPIAVYPVGTRVGDVKHFDRSTKILFACPNHPESAWASKDPFVSAHFPQSDSNRDCMLAHTHNCSTALIDYVVTHEYKPTRNG